MAKKKKTTQHHKPRRRKKVGAISNDLVMTIVGGIAGAAGGKLLANFAAKTFPSLSPTMLQWGTVLVEAGGGYLLAKRSGPGFMKGAGLGLAISGGLKAATNLGLPGMGRLPVMIPTRKGMVGGFRDVPRLGAVNDNTANGGFPTPARVGKVDNMTAVYAGGAY